MLQSILDQALERKPASRILAPGVGVIDDLLPDPARRQVFGFLRGAPWQFGWKSKGSEDTYSFWHAHFAGHKKSRHEDTYACEHELAAYPVLQWLWGKLRGLDLYENQTLVRCYANGMAYGTDGSVHTDSKNERSYTAIYYPHDEWNVNWGGETVILNHEQTDVVACIYPKPNRLAIFRGRLPHVARGVSRTCPKLRITLMLKTEVLPDAGGNSTQGKPESVPAGAGSEPDPA